MRAALALLLAGCGVHVAPPVPTPERAPRELPRRRLVLVTLDGVRAEDLFAGGAALAPNLWSLAERGVAIGDPARGASLTASGPSFVSLPGYQELLGGRVPACADNECAPIAWPTLLDELRQAGLGADEVVSIPSWERLERAVAQAPAQIIVSAGRRHGVSRDRLRADAAAGRLLDAGAVARPWPGYADYRPDALTGALALAWLRARHPRALHVGLGDTDELAHRGDFAGYLGAVRRADAILGDLVAVLTADDPGLDDTIVAVTCDHGRGAGDAFRDHGRAQPSSARVWLVLAGGGVPARGRLALTAPWHLANIAPTLRPLLGLDVSGARDGIAELLAPPASDALSAAATR